MTYVEGFVSAVPTANRQAYGDHAAGAVEMFKEFGATRMVETWGDDVPVGKHNDLRGAVQATDDETVVFSWMEFADKPTRDAAMERMMADPRTAAMGQDMPFDAGRMIYASFETLIDDGASDGGTSYVDGFVLPVSPANRDAYVAMATRASTVFRDHGALRVVEAWGVDVPEGKVTDFRRAALAEGDEGVVFSWVEWPDKATRDAGMKAVFEDERMKTESAAMPFDGSRMIYGGFAILLDA